MEDETGKTTDKAEGTVLEKVDCRESLCRASLIHDDEKAYESYYNGAGLEGSWVVSGSDSYGNKIEREDGTIESFVYFTKRGDRETFLEMRKNILKTIDMESTSQGS